MKSVFQEIGEESNKVLINFSRNFLFAFTCTRNMRSLFEKRAVLSVYIIAPREGVINDHRV